MTREKRKRLPRTAAHRRRLKEECLVAELLHGGDDDELLATIARERADAWAKAPAGTAYDNTDIRTAAAKWIAQRVVV